jgi:hypothetical protein
MWPAKGRTFGETIVKVIQLWMDICDTWQWQLQVQCRNVATIEYAKSVKYLQ